MQIIMEWNYREDDDNFTDFDDETTFDEFQSFEENIDDTLFVVGTILVICGIVENLLICWILIRTKKCLRSFSNFHLLNLAITDILFRIVSTLYFLLEGSELQCKIADFGTYATLAVTFALLAGIAFDCYIHIVHPFRARAVTWKHSRNLVALSWIYGVLCSAPFLYSTKCLVYVDEETLEKFWKCYDLPGLPFQISVTVFIGCSFLAPLIFMGVVYSRIVSVLWNRARKKMINKNMAKTKLRAVKMMVVIVLTYLITWGPRLTLMTMDAFHFHQSTIEEAENEEEHFDYETEVDEQLDKEHLTSLVVNAAFDTLSLASSILNPLIFGYYNSSFREELKNILFGIKCTKCFMKRKQKIGPHPMQSHVTTGCNSTELNIQTTTL